LRRKQIYTPRPGWGIFLARLTGALVLLAAVALWTSSYFDWIAMREHPALRVGALLLVLTACAIVYFGALLVSGFRFSDFKRVGK
jgi:putative peptidoglycan lipid II flippase